MAVSNLELIEEKRDEDAYSKQLLRFIYEIDTKAFFSSLILKLGKDYSNIDAIYDNESKLVYCTSNVLYAITHLYMTNNKALFEILTCVEKSIREIEHLTNFGLYINSIGAIQKYRLVYLKNKIGYQSAFDNEVKAIHSRYRNSITNSLNSISSNSDFSRLSLNIELYLEYYWQTMQWEKGEKACNILIEIIDDLESDCDSTIRKALVEEIEKLKKCQALLLNMQGLESGESKLVTANMQSSVRIKGAMGLYNTANSYAYGLMSNESIIKDVQEYNLSYYSTDTSVITVFGKPIM